jgi:aminobenzoyl-glutamate utilization protein B
MNKPISAFTLTLLFGACAGAQTTVAPEKEAAWKAELTRQIDTQLKQAQVMVDSVYSFAELGFQEVETSK